MTTNTNDRRIDYVEFNVADIERSKEFYGGAFGWSFKDYGPQYCEFSDGRLTGGFTTTAPVSAKGGPLVILYAADIENAHRRVEAAVSVRCGRLGVPAVAGGAYERGTCSITRNTHGNRCKRARS